MDKFFRALNPVTWVATAGDIKTYYNCPVCGRRVWAYGGMVGTQCLNCPGSGYQQQQEDNARRERERHDAEMRRQREQHERQLREQREEHRRQLRVSQTASLKALKNEKAAAKQGIVTNELNVVARKIKEIEEKINDEEKELHKYEKERNVAGHQIIAMLGRTGAGKSALGNRLCGDVSMMAKSGPFKTSNRNKSCTQLLHKHMHKRLSVVDCPGWADTDGKDRTHTNNLCAFLRGCGGINAFVVVLPVSSRFDATFQDQLKYLHGLFGDAFWKHLVVVLTRVDSGIAEQQFKESNKVQEFKDDIARLSKGVNRSVAVIAIGLDNYTKALPRLVAAIPSTKFECDKIKSPIDLLKQKKQRFVNKRTSIQQRIDAISNEITDIDSEIAALG